MVQHVRYAHGWREFRTPFDSELFIACDCYASSNYYYYYYHHYHYHHHLIIYSSTTCKQGFLFGTNFLI
jgi:hypothetical protein